MIESALLAQAFADAVKTERLIDAAMGGEDYLTPAFMGIGGAPTPAARNASEDTQPVTATTTNERQTP